MNPNVPQIGLFSKSSSVSRIPGSQFFLGLDFKTKNSLCLIFMYKHQTVKKLQAQLCQQKLSMREILTLYFTQVTLPYPQYWCKCQSFCFRTNNLYCFISGRIVCLYKMMSTVQPLSTLVQITLENTIHIRQYCFVTGEQLTFAVSRFYCGQNCTPTG